MGVGRLVTQKIGRGWRWWPKNRGDEIDDPKNGGAREFSK